MLLESDVVENSKMIGISYILSELLHRAPENRRHHQLQFTVVNYLMVVSHRCRNLSIFDGAVVSPATMWFFI